MSFTIANALKSEIQRIARKEIRSQIAVTRRAAIQHRRDIALLKRQIKSIEQANRALRRNHSDSADQAAGAATRYSAKGLRSLRARLGLSAHNLGRLLGVGGQSVYNWEQQKSVPRPAQRQAIAAMRGLSKRTAQAKLEALPVNR